MKNNKFVIIVASYNNENWVEYNIASILNQSYNNFKVVYVDDFSTDNTYKKVEELIKNDNRFTLIKNERNMGGTYNHIRFFNEFEDDEICVLLDGDDWFYDELVLEKLNNFYNEKDCWMTYGGFICWDGKGDATTPFPQSTEYPEFVLNNKKFRNDVWRASHLRTYKGKLLKALDKKDFVSKFDNDLFNHAGDLALAFPCLEMCPKEKIGVVDFYTYVYNTTNQNQIRTRERETISNAKYEIEIRNKKKYKEGLSGEKMYQINVFNADYYMEYCDVPKKFSYCYQQIDGEYDMTLFCDLAILEYIEGKYKLNQKSKIVARTFEQREYFNRKIYNALLENYEKFDCILTYDRELLKLLPNAKFLPVTEVTQFNRLPNPANYPPLKSEMFDTYELPENLAFKMHPKTKLVSAVVSSKAFLPGHVKRLNFIKSVQTKIDLFGRGIKEIPSKLDALRDYMFSIAIENTSVDDNYFSEKIIDCFLTGTIPIYHGCTNIGEFFDERGILTFNTEKELNEIIDSLSEEKYHSLLEFAKINYEKCFDWPLNNDMLYEMYYKKIIEK